MKISLFLIIFFFFSNAFSRISKRMNSFTAFLKTRGRPKFIHSNTRKNIPKFSKYQNTQLKKDLQARLTL